MAKKKPTPKTKKGKARVGRPTSYKDAYASRSNLPNRVASLASTLANRGFSIFV